MSHNQEDLKVYWNKIKYAFPILNDTVVTDCSEAEYEEIHEIIIGLGIQVKIRDLVLIHTEKYLRQHVAPLFWSKFTKVEEKIKGFQLFKSAVNDLYESVSSFAPILQRLTILNNSCNDNKPIYGEKDITLGFNQLVRATLLSQLPLDFHVLINHFYNVSFKVFDNEINHPVKGEEVICTGCWHFFSDCNCAYIVKVFHDTNRKLMELQLLERLTGQVLTSFSQVRIASQMQNLCSFEVSHIGFLNEWLETSVISWLTRIYCAGSSKPPAEDTYIHNAISKFRQKLSYFMHHSYTMLRIDQLFSIIIEYPDSLPAVEDIRIGLQMTDLRPTLCKKLQSALETRLLHPGVNTPDILTAYISTIKALRYIDPTGVILETVTKPVKNYLRNREDTVRSVVSSLTEEGTGCELAEELAKFASEPEDGDEDTDEMWEEWVPDPVDADPKVNSSDRRANDIISMLVNVYGSKELFVNEYRTLLADRLLAQNAINTEREIRYLELLKLRFGESQLHFCEVMLKDISDSKRINALIQQEKSIEELNKKFTSNAMILSAQFWPPFKDESLELPEEIKQHLEAYTKSFEALKGNRTLSWKPHLGNVNIEIEIGEKKLDLTVSPFNATLIMHFQNKPEWSIEELHQVMKVPVTVLRRKITYWQSMGLIAEKIPDHFVLIDGSDPNKGSVSTNQVQDMICEDDEAESAMASAHDQRECELQVFWSYIVGMLTNLDSLPLDRIHQMLKMFASQAPGTECSLQELRQFLDTKVRTHQLVFQGGMYKLPKNL